MPAIVQGPITGAEAKREDGSAFDAIVDFYRAFNGGDLAALERNWAQGDEPSIDNPIGGIRRGWDEISAVYRQLFEGPARVTVAFGDYTHQEGSDWALFVGRERGVATTADKRLVTFRTTRWFIRHDGVWRQLHHHGSIEKSALLADFQRMIFGAPL